LLHGKEPDLHCSNSFLLQRFKLSSTHHDEGEDDVDGNDDARMP
jgi:hypothetical protein